LSHLRTSIKGACEKALEHETASRHNKLTKSTLLPMNTHSQAYTRNLQSSLEALEARIAPAKLLTLVDVDGDLITITTSKGTDAQLAAVVSTSSPAGAVTGGVQINAINLQNNAAAFDGTDLTVTAKPGPLGGNGLVNVSTINATGLSLGTVTIKGDLQDVEAGNSAGGPSKPSMSIPPVARPPGTLPATWARSMSKPTFVARRFTLIMPARSWVCSPSAAR
jgi:hypothetical protein